MTGVRGSFLVLLAALLILVPQALATNTPDILPSGLVFPDELIGSAAPAQGVTIFNIGTTSFAVNTATVSATQFKIVSGTTPVTIAPNTFQTFQVQFTPDSAKTITGKLSFTFSNSQPESVGLSGKGLNAAAIPVLNTTSLDFGNQALGANGPSQTLTVTNKGTAAVRLATVTVTYPFFQTGWKSSTSIKPGKSLSMQISFLPYALGSASGTIMLNYDVATTNGVSLFGTAVSPGSLGSTTFPTLPAATQNAVYQANLTAAGGRAPYSWTLASGSSLPSGLSLGSGGTITGTLASSVAIGSYAFSVTATDSSKPPLAVTSALTLPVKAPTGANCSNISVNASDGSGPLQPLTDLGTNLYLGIESGGLYANGSNQDDPAHDAYGQGLAAGIQPLDANGNPSPTGKYAFVVVGLSVTQQSAFQFVPLANADPAKNANLVVVDGGSGGATAAQLVSPTNNIFWEAITNDYLPNAGVTANQVVAAWFMDVDGGPAGTFPNDMTNLQSQLESIAQNLLTFFPNIKIAYASSMYYTGYSVGIVNLTPEPYAYESGFAVKNMIQDQLNGNSNLNFDPTKGTVMAPWLAWGPYMWANGLLPRSDGLVWGCQDVNPDGTHPQNPAGRNKVSTQLLNFLSSDDTAAPWFLAPGALQKRRNSQQK